MMNHGVVHFEIPASDPEKLSQFYARLFGWKIERMEMGPTAYYMTSTVETDEQGMPKQPGAINGGIAQRTSPGQTPVNYVNVESVDEYLQKAKGLGAKELMGKMPVPGMGYFAILTDLEGNAFGLWENDTSAA